MHGNEEYDADDLPDAGSDVCSGANNFDYPQYLIPAKPEQGKNTGSMLDAFFEQPRRGG